MPSGPVAIAVADVGLPPEPALQQLKQCSTCHCPLVQADMSTGASQFVSIPDLTDNALVCGACRERLVAERQAARDVAALADLEQEIVECELTRQQLGRAPSDDTPMLDVEQDYDFTPEPPVRRPSSPVPPAPPVYTPLSAHPSHSQPFTKPSKTEAQTQSPHFPPSALRTPPPHPAFVNHDPWQDITNSRIRTQAHDCLYPGATFVGTQRSGRNAYDVTVTIVDVDLAASFLCGYLRISGLTEDHPELTTYFDAEIIGPRYGFLTEQDWGATETEDMTHWARFPAFRSVRPELRKPQLTMRQRDRGVVFMRWKEKFLLPDHRVKDIHGASFAGFYYVCVEFGSGAAPTTRRSSTTTDSAPRSHESGGDSGLASPSQREAFPSLSSRKPPPVAVMTGFYFHQHSEPYQQLQLHHVPERATSYFEFR